MGRFGDLIYLFLAAFGPHTCVTQSIIMGQVNRLKADIDGMVGMANTHIRTHQEEVMEFFVWSTAVKFEEYYGNIGRDYFAFINTVESNTAHLAATAGDIDVSECTDLVIPVISTANEIMRSGMQCTNNEVQEAQGDQVSFYSVIDSQLHIFACFQTWAESCVSRYNQSEQSASDATVALTCIKPVTGLLSEFRSISIDEYMNNQRTYLHRSTELSVLRLKYALDGEVAKDLLVTYERRIVDCATSSLNMLPSLRSAAEKIEEEMLACVAKATDSSS